MRRGTLNSNMVVSLRSQKDRPRAQDARVEPTRQSAFEKSRLGVVGVCINKPAPVDRERRVGVGGTCPTSLVGVVGACRVGVVARRVGVVGAVGPRANTIAGGGGASIWQSRRSSPCAAKRTPCCAGFPACSSVSNHRCTQSRRRAPAIATPCCARPTPRAAWGPSSLARARRPARRDGRPAASRPAARGRQPARACLRRAQTMPRTCTRASILASGDGKVSRHMLCFTDAARTHHRIIEIPAHAQRRHGEHTPSRPEASAARARTLQTSYCETDGDARNGSNIIAEKWWGEAAITPVYARGEKGSSMPSTARGPLAVSKSSGTAPVPRPHARLPSCAEKPRKQGFGLRKAVLGTGLHREASVTAPREKKLLLSEIISKREKTGANVRALQGECQCRAVRPRQGPRTFDDDRQYPKRMMGKKGIFNQHSAVAKPKLVTSIQTLKPTRTGRHTFITRPSGAYSTLSYEKQSTRRRVERSKLRTTKICRNRLCHRVTHNWRAPRKKWKLIAHVHPHAPPPTHHLQVAIRMYSRSQCSSAHPVTTLAHHHHHHHHHHPALRISTTPQQPDYSFESLLALGDQLRAVCHRYAGKRDG
jgi:hypothetical protein